MLIKLLLVGLLMSVLNANELKVLNEAKFSALLKSDAKYEASGVYALKDKFFVVFDNGSKVAKVNKKLTKAKLNGKKIKHVGYEAISYDKSSKVFYLLEESVKKGKHYYGRLHVEDKREFLDFELQSDNKGFEGLSFIEHNNKSYLFALCEGNDCKAGKKSKKVGKGRVVLFKKEKNYVYVKTIKLPKSVAFVDYSGMDIDDKGRVAIVSQESSALWVGSLNMKKLAFKKKSTTYTFPLSKKKHTIYCNVEGVSWIDESRLVVVSDASKSTQDKRCKKKEQSVHIVSIH